MAGPRSEPPMPMLTTSLNGFFVLPTIRPLRTLSANPSMRSRSFMTVRSISAPPIAAPWGWRKATCRTDRPSVELILSPRHIASMRARRPRVSAVSMSFASTTSSILWREKSIRRPAAWRENLSNLPGSRANSSCVGQPLIRFACAPSSAQVPVCGPECAMALMLAP